MHIAELSLHLLGAQVWPVVVPTPRNPHPVPVRSTGASEALGGLAPAIRAMSARGPIVDVTLEGLMHAKDTSAIL